MSTFPSTTATAGALGLLGVMASATTAVALVRPDRMLVEHIEVHGAVESSEASLRHLIDVRNGTRIWQVDAEKVAELAVAHPWVRHAHAEVRWPDTVVLTVEERRAVAVLHGDEALYLDEDGTPFLSARSGRVDLPHLTGFAFKLEALHPQLPHLAAHDALWLLRQLEVRGLQRLPVSEVAFSTARGFTVHHGAARVVFGHSDLNRQLDRLERLVREQGVDLTQPVHIDLAPASVAIVRPRDLSAAEGT